MIIKKIKKLIFFFIYSEFINLTMDEEMHPDTGLIIAVKKSEM